ncbi:MAG: hypothetical protein RIS94_3183 [Pseudomonadota bacterium]|jgi:osmotically-inducible protein OsmY
MNDRYDRDRDDRWSSNDTPGEQAPSWRRDEERGNRWSTGNDSTRARAGARSGAHDYDPASGERQSGYGSRFASGYGSRNQTGDYFGPGDFGSGSQAYAANWDRSYGGGSRTDFSGARYGAGQSVQRDSRQWGDRQVGGYERGEGYARDGGHRGFIERATDEVMSWWGDEDAARRREADHAGKGPSDYTRSDERIREDANDRLTDDWRVDARSITVTVDKGEVTLNGTVPTRPEKHRAEECVERISGVRHVQNNIRVADGSQTAAANWETAGTTARS